MRFLDHRQQQLGGRRRALRLGRGDRRQRHAPVDRRADHLVSRVDGRFRTRRSRRRRRASPASRCPALPASSSAATVTSPGDSPTPAATGATLSASSRIRAIRRSTSHPTDRKPFEVFDETIAAKGGAARDRAGALDRSGDRSCGRTRAAASTRSGGSRTIRRCSPPTSTRPERTRIGRRAHARHRRPRHPEPERHHGRRPRAASRGRSAARFRGASASTASRPNRGPTDRASGTAI